MGRSLIATDSQPTPMNRRKPDGTLYKVEPNREEYAQIGPGIRARWMLTGISDEFEMQSQFTPDGKSTCVRVEFLLVKGNGNAAKMHEGKRWTDLYSWKMGPGTKLGKLVGSLRGAPVTNGENINPDDYIGTEFIATTAKSDKSDKTVMGPIEVDGIRLPVTTANGAQPAADAVTEDNPFDEDL